MRLCCKGKTHQIEVGLGCLYHFVIREIPPDRRAGGPTASCDDLRGLHPVHCQSGQAPPPELRPALAHRAVRPRIGHECLRVATPLQSCHGDEPPSNSRSNCDCRRPAVCSSRKTSTRKESPLAWGTRTPPTSIGSTKVRSRVPPMRDVQRQREATRAEAGR